MRGGDFEGTYRIAALNALAMIPISVVLSNTLFPVLRGIMGYQIEKADLETTKQSSTNQKSDMQIEEIDSSEVVQTQNASTSLQAGNEEAVSDIGEVAPTDTHDNPASPVETTKQSSTDQKPDMQIEEIESSDVEQTQNASTPLQAGNEEAMSDIIEADSADINDKAELAKH